ncbi:peptide chain release factor 2 [Wolbachia endosymbiont of Listronotus oregonensis]|uniref:peptide chain release factor 2 n=1 Tax=unclassified Wolbachia TaxID=2640676 RepID=UPI00209F2328|nr:MULTISPECIES: peptide chain release factor 2 [Rickettsiales]MBV2146451.1 peptide chain release factor 2 [Wolbachia endosymbiont of Pissodes strobi]WMT84615.1 peptide chain release factor 2 [Wolbachia endosymbiont of Listronotus oregonensis]
MKTYSEIFEYFQGLNKSISLIRRCLDIEKLKLRLEELDSQASNDNLWQDNQKAQEILKERSKIKHDVELFLKLESDYNDAISLMKSAIDENDEEFFSEVESELAKLEKLIKLKETESLFTGEADNNNCFLEIHSGAGGTESNDWAEMLMRMYVRWAEIYHNFKVEVVEKLEGESVGIKSAMIKIVGEKAYGWAKSESGIHRLVRISPFDANGKRHTSFASVGVTPVIEDSIDIAVDEKDLKIDTYRASGAGGQHVNKTESAVRITHIPTGVVVQCQNGRSQHRNKDEALKLLKGRLYQIELEKKEQKMAEEYGKKCDIGWGNQIRSYVMHPYQMVKDLRTGHEVGNINSVFDGNIDCFIVSVLTKQN